MHKKNLPILLAIFLVTGVAAYLLLFWRVSAFQPPAKGPVGWQYRQEEKTGRIGTVPILLYHNIDGKGPFSVDLDTLREHFIILKNSDIRVTSLSEFVEMLGSASTPEGRTVAISFDDGYLSMYTKLLPLCREYGYPITLFVYTDNVYARARKSITWERLRELEAGGISVESHSISHPDLVQLQKDGTPESKKRLFEEIYLSRRTLEKYLGKEIEFFAFPYGRYNIPLIRLCMYAGYKRVFSTDYGSNVLTRDNYCLRRQHIKRDYSLDYIEKLVQ